VTIVEEMVTKGSFASRGSERREWLKCGQTRTGTTHLMVCLSLVCHCPGVRPLFVKFWLGETKVLLEEGTLLDELNRSDRFGNQLDRFGLFVQRNLSDRFQNHSDRFGGSMVTVDTVF
jgi:hypothetical protein